MYVTGLTQILALVIAEVRGSINKDINGAELLHSLLNAPWLQSLLKVESILHKRIVLTVSYRSGHGSSLFIYFFSEGV